jgi:hypothetical protein
MALKSNGHGVRELCIPATDYKVEYTMSNDMSRYNPSLMVLESNGYGVKE